MSDNENNPETNLDPEAQRKAELAARFRKAPDPEKQRQLEDLKRKADSISAKYHPRAGIKKVKEAITRREEEIQMQEQIKAHQRQQELEAGPANSALTDAQLAQEVRNGADIPMEQPVNGTAASSSRYMTFEQFKKQRAEDKKHMANKLVRIRIQCMDPQKKDWPGEIISVGSSKLGTYKKYVPYGTGEPYHVPWIIYQHLLDKKCSVFYNAQAANGMKVRKSRQINAYAIELLPPLTQEELRDLARKQAMSAGKEVA